MPGFPIRKSSDHSPVAGSSRLIAGSNVLHRLLVPRHPPYALRNLAKITQERAPPERGTRLDARVHYAVLKIRTEPCIADLHPETRDDRPFESAPWVSGCFLRTQQRALNPLRCLPSFRAPCGELVLAGQRLESEPNSQCSTRKHGRSRSHSLRKSAGAP